MTWKKVLPAAIGVLAAVVAATWAAGGPPGSGNWRYPHYITHPRVNCGEEGVFQHPRNCSWYYRCHDNMNLGYYRTFYFECEAGTVFSDDLDQCVFPFLVPPPCGSNLGSTQSTPLVTPTTTLPTPIVTPTLSPSSTPTPTVTPTPTPTLPPTPTVLPTPTVSPSPSITPTITVTPPTPPPVTANPVPCTFREEYCETKVYCDPEPKNMNLCSGCSIGDVFIPALALCQSPANVYDKDEEKCIEMPQECPPSSDGVAVSNTNTLVCSDENTIPDDEWIKDTYCSDYALCDEPNVYTGTIQLCDNYFECSRTPAPESLWEFHLKNCTSSGEYYYYSYATNDCTYLHPDEVC